MAKLRALVCGAGGFIGSHLVARLAADGFWVRGVDLHLPKFSETQAANFMLGDLRQPGFVAQVFGEDYDEIYQLAADMGGAGYIFTGDHDSDIMRRSALINLNILDFLAIRKSRARTFYSSSACVYPVFNQADPTNPLCEEGSAYPAMPDSEYGWEKLFSERLYLAQARNYGLEVRIARYHNVFGPLGAWRGGREKAPAAICRKVAEARDGDVIEIWGDGLQTRTFLYVDECVEGTLRLMRSNYGSPINIGSDELISINQFVDLVCTVAGKRLEKRHITGPQGVRGRTSDNRNIERVLHWRPREPLIKGVEKTYHWIEERLATLS